MKREASDGIGRRLLRSLLGWSICAVLTVVVGMALIVSGCSQRGPTSSSAPPPGSTADPLAIGATIDDSGFVQPGTVNLSKKSGSRVQWHNLSSDTMMIILMDSHVAELVPPTQYSASHRVCLSCSTGFYPYAIKRMAKGVPTNPEEGPPGEPQVGVGD